MKQHYRSIYLAAAMITCVAASQSKSQAQNAILSEMYGRGVHAYFAGNHNDSYQLLSSAIQGGMEDPRAYYFRGLAANASGRQYEAEADWQAGAELEAKGKSNASIGQALSRFQGYERMKLEEIRRKAKLDALIQANLRSDVRYGELGAQPREVSGAVPATGAAPTAKPPVTSPPTPPAASEANPFADDLNMAEPKVESSDAFGDVLDNVPMDAPSAVGAGDMPADGAADPFGGGAPAGGAADPFGGAAPDAGGAAPDAGGAAPDPFGGADPFGN